MKKAVTCSPSLPPPLALPGQHTSWVKQWGRAGSAPQRGLSISSHTHTHPPQSSHGTAPSLEAVTPRGTPGLSLHSSPGPMTPSLLPGQLPLSPWFAGAMGSPTRGTVVLVFAWSHQPVQASDWLACPPHQPLEVCVWCCSFPDITLMEWVGNTTS